MYYSKMFELISDEINFLIERNTPKNKYELKKIEIKGNEVKLVFLDKILNKVKTMIYEFDSPKLILKKII